MKANVRGRLAPSLLLPVPLVIGTKFYAGPAHAQVHAPRGWGALRHALDRSRAPGGPSPLFGDGWWCAFRNVRAGVSTALDPLAFQTVRRMFTGHTLVGSTFGCWDLLHYGLRALLGALPVRNIRRTTPDDWGILPGEGSRPTPNYIFQGREV